MRRLLPSPSTDVDLVDAYAYPPERPWLRANMVASVDGAATAEGLSGGLSGEADRRVFGVLRSLADVVLVGAGTVRAEGYRPAALPIAVVSNRLDLDLSAPLFTAAAHRTLVLTSGAAVALRLAAVREVADVAICGAERVDPGLAVQALRDRGHARLLCEGGPGLLGQLAVAGLLDELCLTISPVLAGGDASRVLTGLPVAPPARLRLQHLLEDEGFLFARYAVRRG